MKKLIALFAFTAFACAAHAQVSINITTTNVTCNSACDGSATAIPSGGTPPYTYAWTPAVFTTATATNLCPGTYTITVTDQIGGTATQTCVITQPTALNVTSVTNPTSICAGNSVNFNLNASGGTGAYTYYWSFPGGSPSSSTLQNPTVTYNSTGMYNAMCTVTDANGCVAGLTITITVSGGPNISITEVPSSCNQTSGILYGSGAVTYTWQPGNLTGSTISNVAPNTTYTCIGTDPMGCSSTTTFVTTDSCNYVWPGDANDDATADNLDILAIGSLNGATGTTRPSATTNWIGQWSAEWLQFQVNGSDYKYVDCDGNGIIDPADTNAVVLNYGMIHNNRLIAPSTNAAAPTLSISFDQDSLNAGQTGTITLSIGDTVDQVTNGYGLAFRLNYDAMQLSTPTFGMMGGATWFGTPGNDLMRVVLHPNAANGYVDVAITRLDQQNVNGYGMIGKIYFTTTTNLAGTGNTANVAATITNVTLTDATGTTQTVNVSNDNVVVADTGIILNVAPIARAETVVWPNPANETLQLQLPSGAPQMVSILDLSGRMVYSQQHTGGVSTISVVNLPAGTYMLRTTDGAGNTSTQKITIAH